MASRGRVPGLGFAVAIALAAVASLFISPPLHAEATPGKGSARHLEPARKTHAAATTRSKKKALQAQRARAAAQAEADRLDAKLDGKIAVFTFKGDDTPSLRAPVLKVLREHGFTVVTDLRPVDLAEQFRDLAAALDVIAFVEGNVTDQRDKKSRVAVAVRSGYSGRRVASSVLIFPPDDGPDEVTEKLWHRLGPALRRARADADKPRRKTRAPMQINAGTPIDSRPAPEPVRVARTKAPD
jgi:hypothetical protein